MSRHSSPFPSCFRPSAADDHHKFRRPAPISGHSNLATCVYQTHLASFSLSWSRSILSRSLLLHLHPHRLPFDSPPQNYLSLCSASLSASSFFHLSIKPLVFWKNYGSKKLSPSIRVYWDLRRAKFSSGPEPISGFFVAVTVSGDMALLVGDLTREAYARTKALKSQSPQSLLVKREHVVAQKIYSTKVNFGGKIRDLEIDCGYNDDSKLSFSFDNKRVLEIKGLRWKFRGNEKIEVDGVVVQVSWDVYNWVFEEEKDDGRVVFMFRFGEEGEGASELMGQRNGTAIWGQQQSWNLGINGMMMMMESRKSRKSLSSSSVSMSSSGSSAGSSSVMEWDCVEDSELNGGPSGFSLLIYACKR